jgi:phage tail sheath protein FI
MSALQDLNVRLVANEIKKLIFKTCIDLTFELNNIMTWNEFKSKIEPTLSVMLGEGVLSSYEILMGSETMTVADLNSGHVVGTVKIAVTRAATDWDINFELTPNGATFTEYDYNSSYAE